MLQRKNSASMFLNKNKKTLFLCGKHYLSCVTFFLIDLAKKGFNFYDLLHCSKAEIPRSQHRETITSKNNPFLTKKVMDNSSSLDYIFIIYCLPFHVK